MVANEPPNDQLRMARLRLPSPSGSGRPMSRQELADLVNAALAGQSPAEATLDANYVGKLERGKHRWPSRPRRRALCQVLNVASESALGFYINRTYLVAEQEDDHRRTLAQRVPTAAAATVPEHNRRELLKAIATVATGYGLLGAPVARPYHRVGLADIHRINAVIGLYRTVDYEHGGGAVYPEVARFAEATSTLLTTADAGRWYPQLAAAVAGARHLAGWTAFDTGRHSDAGRHWLVAEHAALASGDLRIVARIRYCQARQFQHLAHNQDALATLRLTQAQLDTHATPALQAMLHGAEAASLAALGDHTAAAAALQLATERFDRSDPHREPEWMRFYDRGELLAQYGRVHRDRARGDARYADDAVNWTQRAINALDPQSTRSRVLNEVGLCSALALAGDTQQAIEVGAGVLAQSRQLTSRRVHDRIRNLTRDLPTHPRDSSITDFRHHLSQIPGHTP